MKLLLGMILAAFAVFQAATLYQVALLLQAHQGPTAAVTGRN